VAHHLERLRPGEDGHHHVHEDEVRALLAQALEGLPAIAAHGHLVALVPQHVRHDLLHVELVLDDQDGAHFPPPLIDGFRPVPKQ
jgi:hypothetical protein